MSAVSDNLYNLLRAQAQGSTKPIVKAALFETVGEFCRLILQVQPPADYTTDQATWITDAQWLEHHTIILAGTLARLYAMPGKPWTNAEAAKAQAAYYELLLPRAREVAAATVNGVGFDRLLANLRSAIPGMRDTYIEQEVFNTVDDLTRNHLALPAPDPSADPKTWLTDQQWGMYYRLAYAGTVARCLAQPGKPWSDDKLAEFYRQQWSELLTFARSDAAENANIDPSARLVQSIKSRLPNAKESQVRLALFDVLQDACQRGFLWTETLPFRLDTDKQVFGIAQPGARIVRLSSVSHPVLDCRSVSYSEGKIAISTDISTLDRRDYLYLTISFAPSLDVDMEQPGTWIPMDLYASKYTLLLNGVLGAMMLQTAKAYSNTQLGQFHSQLFSRELNASPLIDRDGGLPTRQRWRFPRFA